MRVVKSQLSHSLGALALLAESGRGMRLTDVTYDPDLPKNSMQRPPQQLADEGWVEQDPDTGYYRLTLRMAVLGQRHLQSIGIADSTHAILAGSGLERRRALRPKQYDWHNVANSEGVALE
jgi:IclR family transcriptional regulator, acetate operon repressor